MAMDFSRRWSAERPHGVCLLTVRV